MLHFDESTVNIGTEQLWVLIQILFDEMHKLLQKRTRGQDVFHLFKNYVVRINFSICKLVSITTDDQ